MYAGTPYQFTVPVFQTQFGNQCHCDDGPTVAIPNANNYFPGTTAFIYWDGLGGPGQGNMTSGPITLGSTGSPATLTSFPGQLNNQTHYASNVGGSYNVIFMVNYGGCTTSLVQDQVKFL